MEKSARIGEICAQYGLHQHQLLPILHAVQREFGCIDQEAEAILAQVLNLTRAEVHGVVSFYHDFEETPDPRPQLQICRAEACKARGVENLMDAASAAAGDRVCLKDVYCLGLCAIGPNARLGDDLYSRLDAAGLKQLIEQA